MNHDARRVVHQNQPPLIKNNRDVFGKLTRWSEAELALLHQLWASGMWPEGIARRIGRSTEAVKRKVYDLKLPPHEGRPPSRDGCAKPTALVEQEAREVILAALRDGLTEPEAAAAAGVSVHAAQCVRQDARIPRDPRKRAAAVCLMGIEAVRVTLPELPSMIKSEFQISLFDLPAELTAVVVEVPPEPVPSRLQCRWLNGERRHYVQCGERSVRGSYCAEHADICYVPREMAA